MRLCSALVFLLHSTIKENVPNSKFYMNEIDEPGDTSVTIMPYCYVHALFDFSVHFKSFFSETIFIWISATLCKKFQRCKKGSNIVVVESKDWIWLFYSIIFTYNLVQIFSAMVNFVLSAYNCEKFHNKIKKK